MAKPVEQLILAMQAEVAVHEELADVLDGKLDALKCRDMSRLESLNGREQELVEVIRVKGQLRETAVEELVVCYYPQRVGERISARELAQESSEPWRSKLLAMTAMLREIATKVSRLNRINAIAMRKMMGHFDTIFNAIAQCGQDIGLYGRQGKELALEQRSVIDAIA